MILYTRYKTDILINLKDYKIYFKVFYPIKIIQ